MRSDDILGPSLYRDLVCMTCFVLLANEAGIGGQWRLSVAPAPDNLTTVTPSGRVWDEHSWLWVAEGTGRND